MPSRVAVPDLGVGRGGAAGTACRQQYDSPQDWTEAERAKSGCGHAAKSHPSFPSVSRNGLRPTAETSGQITVPSGMMASFCSTITPSRMYQPSPSASETPSALVIRQSAPTWTFLSMMAPSTVLFGPMPG